MKKTAVKRVCNVCLENGAKKAPPPAASAATAATSALLDINSIRIKQMKQELESYGISTGTMFERTDLVDALVDARKARQTPSQC